MFVDSSAREMSPTLDMRGGPLDRHLPTTSTSTCTNGTLSSTSEDEASTSKCGSDCSSRSSADGSVNGHGHGHKEATRGVRHRKRMARKVSSPLAPAFMVSAPGKVIVYGEHAVVHGKAAMAAAISLRSYLLVTTLSKSYRTITLNFGDIGLDHTWDIDALPWDAFKEPSRKKRYYDLVTSLDPELVASMKPHIASISPNASLADQKIHQAAASAFLYLFMSLCDKSSPGCVYTLRSTIPMGAGLGSSASTSVCFSSALLIQSRALSGPHPDQLPGEAEQQRERINRWAFVGEMLIHGNPSGVDNTVSTGGKAVLFKRTDYTKAPTVKPLPGFPELPLLLVDTQQPKSTAAEVAKVAHFKKTQPLIANHILEAIDGVTEAAYALIKNDDLDPKDPVSLAKLGELVSVNHGLLVALGVSHPKLERLRQLIDEAGVGWTKLTGAGGGGCAFAILKPETSSPSVGEEEVPESLKDRPLSRADALKQLEAAFQREGFEKYETTLGGDGVGVLYPAVLDNGSDEVGGEEIDQEKFIAAEGREGVERLVGVIGNGGRDGAVRDSWKFWRVNDEKALGGTAA